VNNTSADVQTVYRSTSGGASWTSVMANLPSAPANSLVVDPEDANTVYVATDDGVYSTRQIATCASLSSGCWTGFGSGLPQAPAVALEAAPATASVHDLVVATYGRGIWMTPLWTSGEIQTTATASPISLAFANQVSGTSSSAKSVVVENTGSGSLLVSSIVVSGDFSEADTCQGAVVNADLSCTITVTFTPSKVGPRTGQMSINANVPNGQLTVALSGTGTAASAITLNPASISFNSQKVGTTSAPLPLMVNNSSTSAVAYTTAITGPFAISSDVCKGTIPKTGSCQLKLTFTPVKAGAASGVLTITDSYGKQTAALSGIGLAPATDTLSATALSFPNTIVGQLSSIAAAQSVTLTNSGGVELTSISISIPASQPFVETNNCTANLSAHSSCTIEVQFKPSAVGAASGVMTVKDSLHTQTVTLSGKGLQPPAFTVSPASLVFKTQLLGQASSPQTITFTNTGGAVMSGIGLDVANPSSSCVKRSSSVDCFALSANTCATLAPGATCSARVVFTPFAAGGSTASLVVSSATLGTVKHAPIPLNGVGVALTGLNVYPAQLAFPIVSPGHISAFQTVTVKNTGALDATSLAFSFAGPFRLVAPSGTCGKTLASGASCTVAVVFSPTIDGAVTGSLTISSPTASNKASVTMSGTGGLPGEVQAQPSWVDFSAETGVGQSSGVIAVTLTNPNGNPALKNFTVAVTSGFLLVSNACPSTLAAGAHCTVGVAFTPSSTGAQSGTLTASSSLLSPAISVPLSGTGFGFSISPAAAQTIASGQTASFALQLTPIPLAGSSGTFTLQCGALPSYTSCSFNPSNVVPFASATGSVTVEIATGLSSSSSRAAPPSGWPLLPLSCGLLLLPLALYRRRRALLLLALVAIMAGGVSSCTVSSGSTTGGTPVSGPGITPSGSYTIPITVTSNNVTQSVNLTLTVD
jgi:hypothetical protein